MKVVLRTRCRCEREMETATEGVQRVYIALKPLPSFAAHVGDRIPGPIGVAQTREFGFQGERRPDGTPVFVEVS